MTKDEIIELMLSKKLIFSVGEEYFPITKSFVIEGEKRKKVVSKNPYKWAENLPQKYRNVSKGVIYNQFIADSGIPTWSNTTSLRFMLPTQTLKAEKVLYSILIDPKIDFLKLVTSLKAYYNTDSNTAKTPLAKLLVEGNWKLVYKEPVGDKPDNCIWK